jgi:dishevelled associated activator of morphogenesis
LIAENTDVDEQISQHITDLKRLTGAPYPTDPQEQKARTKLADGLKTAIRTQTQSFVNQFVQANGLQYLLEFLQQMDYDTRQSGMHTAIIGCIKALLNNTYGRGHVLSHARATSIIAQSLYTDNVKTKVAGSVLACSSRSIVDQVYVAT